MYFPSCSARFLFTSCSTNALWLLQRTGLWAPSAVWWRPVNSVSGLRVSTSTSMFFILTIFLWLSLANFLKGEGHVRPCRVTVIQWDVALSFSNALLCCSYSWPKLDHTVANCLVFTWTPCRMLDYLSSSNALWAGDVNPQATRTCYLSGLTIGPPKNLNFIFLGVKLFGNILLHFGRSQLSVRAPFPQGICPALLSRCFFFNPHVVDRSSLPWIKALVSVGFLHHSITSKVAAAVRALVWYICTSASIYKHTL